MNDMMTFIKSDIIVFGLGVLLFITATLWFVFKNLLWIVVPISSCLFSVIIMMGLLGLLGWKVTVISSNFIALMLINFGIFPAVGAQVFVNYCGLPESFLGIPTYPLVMILLLSVALYFVYTGGQIAVIIADFFQGVFGFTI